MITIDLLRRYDRPAPRYTSYPPAPAFGEEFTESEYRALLAQRDPRRPLALYAHLPFCDTLCYFCGCTMRVSHNRDFMRAYLESLLEEIALLREALSDTGSVVQMHWGGGTPTYYETEALLRLTEAFRAAFPFDPEAEISVEADPRGLEFEKLAALRQAGFNRISIGVQDFDPRVQEAVNRLQPYELVAQVSEWVRELGFYSLNFDLIYGLPYQTVERFARTLELVLTLRPDRLAVFRYAHVPHLRPHQRLIPSEALPSAEVSWQIFAYTVERLTAAGYVYIGMDHFALPDDALSRAQIEGTLQRNFMGYTTHADADLLAVGMSGIGELEAAYVQNTRDLSRYREMIRQGRLPVAAGYRMSFDDRLRRFVIRQLMNYGFLDKPRIEAQWGIDFDTYFADALRALTTLAEDGLLELDPDRIRVTFAGRLLIRHVARCFDVHSARLEEKGFRFSRVI
nr:MAG: oxygen-independent coproporphyrinogen III oxidase [Bacteroidota bacterium]